MKNMIMFLCMFSLALYSCKNDLAEPDPKEEPSDVPRDSEAVIGSEGEKLETEEFILTVPVGAFDTTATLRLYLEENEDSVLVNELFVAADSQGFLTCTLPPLEATDLTLKSDAYPNPLDHQVSGEEVCSVIESLTYEYTAYSGDYNAKLLFFWAREKW